MPDVLVPAERFARWVENFTQRHGETALTVTDSVRGEAADGAHFEARLPFDRVPTGAADLTLPGDLTSFTEQAYAPAYWGVLLVRKGGFAVARLQGQEMVSSKVGQRHVQGRTKAGGQSQQRFARRRDNQARAAWQAAAEHAVTHLAPVAGPVVVAGDRQGLDEVLAHPRLSHLSVHHLAETAGVPRRAALEQAVVEALSLRVHVHNG